MYIVNPILKKIIAERHKADSSFTQNKLAEMAGVPAPAISRFDKNERFDIKNTFAIARALDLKVDDLFEITEVEDNN